MLSSEPYKILFAPDYDQEKTLDPMKVKPNKKPKPKFGMRVKLVFVETTDMMRGLNLGDEGTIVERGPGDALRKWTDVAPFVKFDSGIECTVALSQIIVI